MFVFTLTGFTKHRSFIKINVRRGGGGGVSALPTLAARTFVPVSVVRRVASLISFFRAELRSFQFYQIPLAEVKLPAYKFVYSRIPLSLQQCYDKRDRLRKQKHGRSPKQKFAESALHTHILALLLNLLFRLFQFFPRFRQCFVRACKYLCFQLICRSQNRLSDLRLDALVQPL